MTEPPSCISGSVLLHGEKCSPCVEVEGGVEVLLGDLPQFLGLHPTGVGHEDVQRALFLEDSREELVQVRAF
jgi:hypothetical protein